jgi:hypothetical protein
MQQQNLRLLSSSSPVFALFCHTTFSQTQAGAIVPLIPPELLENHTVTLRYTGGV